MRFIVLILIFLQVLLLPVSSSSSVAIAPSEKTVQNDRLTTTPHQHDVDESTQSKPQNYLRSTQSQDTKNNDIKTNQQKLKTKQEQYKIKQTQRHRRTDSISNLFSTPMNQWSLEQFALFLVLCMLGFVLFSCLCCGCGGGGGGCSCMDILACWCCYEMCCDEGPGMAYGAFV